MQSATTADATPGNKNSPREPWSSASGELYKARVWEDLRNLFQQDELTDVMLSAEGQSIPCHRVLLAAASKFFHGKLVIHPESLEHNLLDIEDIDFDTLRSIVYFIYSGHADLTVEKTQKMIPASVSLMLPELTNMCKEFLLEKVRHDTTSCIAIYRIAKANSLDDVGEKAKQVMLKNFQDLTRTDAFKEMPKTELEEYIRDEGLNIASEDPVFEAVVTWVKHDVENRKSSFDSLMDNITLSHCSPGFLEDVVKKEPLMNTMAGWQNLANALGSYLLKCSKYLSVQHGMARQGYSEYSQLIAIFEDDYWTLNMQKDRESEWVRQGSSAGKMLSYSKAWLLDDDILVTGGYLDGISKNQCWKLSIPTQQWTAMPNLTIARRLHAMTCVGHKVYVLGGCSTSGTLQSVEYLEEQNGSWHAAGDMFSALSSHASVNYKHFIYVFGGYGDSQATFMLDTVGLKWSRKSNMPGSCYPGTSVVYRDRIYILGGNQKCCMSYDPDQDQWKTHSNPAVKHERSSAVVWKDRILLCGGTDTSVIEEYNPDTDTWSKWKHQLPKSGYSAVFAFHG